MKNQHEEESPSDTEIAHSRLCAISESLPNVRVSFLLKRQTKQLHVVALVCLRCGLLGLLKTSCQVFAPHPAAHAHRA